MAKCFKCGDSVKEDFERCAKCEEEHKALCAELDARPRVKAVIPKPRWVPANVPGGKLYLE